MGKVSLIAAILVSLIGVILMGNMQSTSRETDEKQAEYQGSQLSRELATKARKLIIANWIELGGATGVAPFSTLSADGGTMSIEDYGGDPVNNKILDFTVRGTYEGAVHEIRSRLEWSTFAVNPLQIKAADIELEIDLDATLNFGEITLDDQALNELEAVLIDDLGLGTSLEDFTLGLTDMVAHIEQELLDSGHGYLSVDVITEAEREVLNQENGMYFPEQVQQAINTYLVQNPGSEMIIDDDNDFPETFGLSGPNVLRVRDNVIIDGDDVVTGEGVLIIEGELEIKGDAVFTWEGLILVLPPPDLMDPKITLEGNTTINGSLIALQEALPNSGHMDVTSFRDMTGIWATPHGIDMYQSSWPWWLYHTHDYTSVEGNTAVFHAPTAAERIHEDRLFFYETLQMLDPNEQVFLEYFNPSNHGRSILTFQLDGDSTLVYPVAAGFDPLIVNIGNQYRSDTFRVGDLDWLQIDMTLLSSLKKLWDNTEEPFPDCLIWGGTNGAICVGETHYRQNALAMRLYRDNGGFPQRIYETAFYWHRQEAEEEDFNDEMEALVNELSSSNYGLHLTIGPNTTISVDANAVQALGTFGGVNVGMTNLGTWHRHWEPGEPGNPYYVAPSSDD